MAGAWTRTPPRPEAGPVTTGVFEIFKIGIGPSSSHTMGPMNAGRIVACRIRDNCGRPARVRVTAMGSLAWTGAGHQTDQALILGLCGFYPETYDPKAAAAQLDQIERTGKILLAGTVEIPFDTSVDLVFDKKTKPTGQANSMRFEAFDAAGEPVFDERWISPGGGAVRCLGDSQEHAVPVSLIYLFTGGDDLLVLANNEKKAFHDIAFENELATKTRDVVLEGIDRIVEVMFESVDLGLRSEGVLPGGLRVQRRAKKLFENIEAARSLNSALGSQPIDYVFAYAMAVNEVNASGGRVVTAPTNGAAGVIPSVLRYYLEHCPGADRDGVRTFILTASIIGAIIKHRASISGAEVGCQGEVGSASAMAAGGLCAALGGTNEQVENAAEIALEHHLGMTCDPIGGLVQVPCIERNGFGASKAIGAASLAIRGDGHHVVSFDQVVETLRRTGLDMGRKYKETSRGGLAVTVPLC